MTVPPPARHLLLTRRRLVQAGAAGAAVLYVGELPAAAQAAGVPVCLRRSGYAGLTGSSFAADGAALRLMAVSDLVRAEREPAFAGRDDAFALRFSGPPEPALAGGIHELRHPQLGSFSLFLAPVGAPGDAQQYEAVVDRSIPLAAAQQDTPEPMAHTNAEAAAPAAAAPGSAPAAPAVKVTKAPKAKPLKLLRGVTLARRGGGITADVRVAAHQGVMSVRATLLRDGLEHARAARMLRGKAGVRLHLRTLRATPAGHYDLRVTVTDRRGRRTVTTRRVTLR